MCCLSSKIKKKTFANFQVFSQIKFELSWQTNFSPGAAQGVKISSPNLLTNFDPPPFSNMGDGRLAKKNVIHRSNQTCFRKKNKEGF